MKTSIMLTSAAVIAWLAMPIPVLADLDQSIADQEKNAQEHPKDWTAHAKLSYLQWQAGNVHDAVAEGQKAVFDAPGNALPLVNLAHIYQAVGEYDYAIPLYDKARNLSPNDWVAWVSLARCQFGKDKLADGIAVLKEMSAKVSDDFAWNYQLGVSYVTIDQPDPAVIPLERAVKVAPTAEQKTAALGELMIAALRSGKTEVATTYLKPFLESNSTVGEAYVRIASAFPDATIFDTAAKNLGTSSDAGETFFRMGRVFEANQKLALAEKCFARAVELDPGEGKNSVGLASVLNLAGNTTAVTKLLDQAAMFDQTDPAPKFVLRHTGKQLLGVTFHAQGITCGCQTTRVDGGFQSQKGVALVSFEHKAPYTGTLILDPAETTLDAAFNACQKSVFPAGGDSIPAGFKFVADKQTKLQTIHDALDLAQQGRYGDPLEYHHKFDPIAPTLVADDAKRAM